MLSERTVVRLDAADAERKQRKWQRVAVEACKQSGQNWLPKVHAPHTIEQCLADSNGVDLKLVGSLQPNARGFKYLLNEYQEMHGDAPSSALILIGPEGDYTPAEIHLATMLGCQPVTLGPIVLRTETAAIFSLSVLAYELMGGA